ncbi:MAG: alkaline phosphatase family protein [Ancrocorticia sp.]
MAVRDCEWWPADFQRPTERSVRASLSAALDGVGLATASGGTTSSADRELLGLPQAEQVCFVLVDGLGYANLAARSGHAATLRSWTHLDPLTTVAPSTTAAAITSVGTGELPGATAMLSYSLRAPSGRNFSLIKWDDPTVDPVEWQREPTLFERLGERASECRLVQPKSYVGSGLTLCALRGAKAAPADSIDDRIGAASRELRRGAKAVYLYWKELDHTGHNKGWLSEDWVGALEVLDAALRQLARRVPRGTLIVVTADHGMVDVTERIDVALEPALTQDVELVSGEERSLHLYTKQGTAAEVAERWQDVLGEQSWVLTKDEAAASGLFGTLGEKARDVMGDVLVFQSGTLSLIDSRLRKPDQSFMRGVHGSLTSDEMLVPLIVEVA